MSAQLTIDNIDFLCLNCTLPDCDEESKECLIRIAKRENPKLAQQIYYQNRLAENGDQVRAKHREYSSEYRAKNPERRREQRRLKRERARQSYSEVSNK